MIVAHTCVGWQPDRVTTQPPTRVCNGDIARQVFEHLNAGDVDAIRALQTTKTVERFPDGTCHGADAIAAYFAAVHAAMPDWRFEIVRVVECDDDVFVHWQLTGTHSGARLQGIDATGRAIALDGIDHFVIRDGAVVSNFVVFDQMQFARQVGLLPPDRSPADRALKAAFNARTRLARLARRLRRRAVVRPT